MKKLIAIALLATMFLSSCGLVSRTLQVPGRTLKSAARTFGF
ncbi:MAG: hypothetical protein ACSHYB_15565 [Roseibacillus sp.]